MVYAGAALLCAVFVACSSLYQHYADPERLRLIAEAYLQRYVAGHVTVGSATFSLLEGVRLLDVAVSETPLRSRDNNLPDPRSGPGGADPSLGWNRARTVFNCEEIEINHSPFAALLGRLEISSLVAFEPTCTIVHDAAVGTTNLADLFQGVADGSAIKTASLPTVELRDARVRVLDHRAGGYHQIENLRLTIRGRPSSRDTRLYDVVWQGEEDASARGHSQIDLRTGYVRNVFGGLPSMSIEAVMLVVNARYDGAGAWRDLLGLQGRVRARDYNLIDRSTTDRPRSATVDLRDASVSIPINEEETTLPSGQRYLRFDHVNGTIEATEEEIRATFAGRFHGSSCEVSAVLTGGVEEWASLDDVDFEAELSVAGLELPRPGADVPRDQARFIAAWPKLERFYRRYDPKGTVDIQLAAVKRTGPRELLAVRRALITARGGSASYHGFPYRGENLTGTVEFRPDEIRIGSLCGQHAGGTVCIEGSFEGTDRYAAAEINITGTSIPVDAHLYGALEPKHREILDQFSPQGNTDVVVTLARPRSAPPDPAPWRTEATVTFNDLSASYEQLPYQFDHLAGELRISRDRMDVVDLSGRSGDTRIHLSGAFELDPSGSHGLDLEVRAEDVPFDDRFFETLPPDIRKAVQPFNPCGRFNVQGTLSRNLPTSSTVQHLKITIADVSVRHDKFPVQITDMEGTLVVSPETIVTSDLAGRYNDADITVEGTYRRQATDPALDLAVRCRDLRLDDAVYTAAPAQLRDLLATWRVDGPVSADVHVKSDGRDDQSPMTYVTEVRMYGVRVKHPLFPVPLDDVHAAITIGEAGLSATGVRARYAEAAVVVDIATHRSEDGEHGTLTLAATDVTLDETVRGLLPDAWHATWDRLKPAGRVDLVFDRLCYERPDLDSPREWSGDGHIRLHDVALSGVADIAHLTGTFTVSGALVDRLAGTSLSGSIGLTAAEVLGRSLQNVESSWGYARAADGRGRFALDNIRGDLYDGRMSAQTEVAFDGSQATYNLSSTLHDMHIRPFLNAVGTGRGPSAANRKPADVNGRANAHVYLSGTLGRPPSRRGGGRVEVVDGYIYRLPIILAILNVLDLSAPHDEAFDDLEADFYIIGNTVQWRNIILRGGVLDLVGSGAMSLKDLSVDLNLVNAASGHWARVPVLTEVIEGVARELVGLHVTGPVGQPTVRPKPLPRLSDELRRLFQKKKTEKVTPAKP